MTRRAPLVLALLALPFAPLLACGDTSQAKELRDSAGQTLSNLKDYAASQRDALLAAVEQRLKDADVDVEALREATSRAAGDVDERTAELRRRVRERMQDVKDASAEGWDRARNRLVDALDELEQALREER